MPKLRFSVLTLLLLVALCAVAASLGARWALPRWRERQAALQVYALGGQVLRWTGEKSIRHAEQAELPYLLRIAGVDYWGQRVTAAHIEPLLELPKLRSIAFWGCTLEPRALERLGECDSRLINLIFRDCTGCDDAFLGSGPIRVCRVGIVRCDISAGGLRRMHLPKTFQFEAQGATHLDDAALAAIRANCPYMQSLDVRGCPVTDAGCMEIARMPKLQTLWLTGSSAVTQAGWQTLASNPSLKEAQLYGTSVSLDQATADGQWQEGYLKSTLERVSASRSKDD